jgi:DNA-binding CsgD family transcriptional regulator
MPLQSLLLYLFSLAVILAVCWQAQKLVQAFRLHFLSSYLGYQVAIGIVFILNLVVTDLSSDVLRNLPPQGMDPVYILFGLVAFPLFAIAFYFALAFAAGILDEDFSRRLRVAYVFFWVVLFAMFLVRIQFVLRGISLPPALRSLNAAFGLAMGIFPIAIYGYMMVRAGRLSRPDERAGLVKFGAVSIAGYLLLIAAMIIPQAGLPFRWAVPVLLGVAALSPVLVLRAFLSRFYRPIPAGTFEGPKLSLLCERHGLSNREGEILGLLLRGKSNKEIERDLYISPHTVRNHIHNIYQKLGVGSRLQLMNFVRTKFEG